MGRQGGKTRGRLTHKSITVSVGEEGLLVSSTTDVYLVCRLLSGCV